jgi:hypothetical protein
MTWPRKVAIILAAALLLGVGTPFLVKNALDRELTRDEHQFVSPGTLLVRQHLLPYKDYPYFHAPYQVALQALSYEFSDKLLGAARLLSMAFGLGCLALIFGAALRYLSGLPFLIRLATAMALPLFMSLNTLFLYTSGRAWNHDLSVFLALSAFLVHCGALARSRPGPGLVASGLLLGLAAGVRLSWAPAALPFLAAVYWLGTPSGQARTWRRGLPFLGGIALAALPWLALFLCAPADTFFGAVVYPGKLTTQFWASHHYTKAMGWSSKLSYFYQHVYLGAGDYHLFGTYYQNKALFLATAVLALPLNLLAIWRGTPWRRESAFLLLVLPVVWLGSALPTPNMYQYYYQMVPFCILALILAVANLNHLVDRPWSRRALLVVLALVAVYCVEFGASACYSIKWRDLAGRGTWAAARVHDLGRDLARLAGQGKVLTLCPTYPLEAGLRIYPEFASGPFAFRVAHLLTPEERRARRMVAPADLEDFLASQPPAAILTGPEKELDHHLATYAQVHGYEPQNLSGSKLVLWLPTRSTPAAQRDRP